MKKRATMSAGMDGTLRRLLGNKGLDATHPSM